MTASNETKTPIPYLGVAYVFEGDEARLVEHLKFPLIVFATSPQEARERVVKIVARDRLVPSGDIDAAEVRVLPFSN